MHQIRQTDMDSIKLLIAASKSMPEDVIDAHLLQFREVNADAVSYVDNSYAIKKVVANLWPKALPTSISSTSLLSFRKAIAGCSHLILLWDGEDLSELLFEARVQKKKTKLIPIRVTKVVNKQDTEKYDVYIGRGTPWGNPFAISREADGPDREDVIERYKQHFNEKMETDVSFRKGIFAMKGLRLACFCKPAPCHGDVIASYLNSHSDDID